MIADPATAISLGMTGIALVTGFGWFIERRRRIAGGVTEARAAPSTVNDAAPALASAPEIVPEAPEIVPEIATDIAAAATDADVSPDLIAEPAELQHAPVPTRRRSTGFLNVARRKRLIALLMTMRTVAGAVAILGAIAVVVFWSIESTERGPRDMGLTWNLLTVTLAGWAGHWGFGGLANWLHRATFNRVHPKFDT